MNIVQLQKAFELMSDQELSQQQEHGFLRDQEVKRRVELRNSYQQAQQQADANKTVSEKNMEELMMGGIPSADPMAGEGGDPSMQAGIAGDMAAEGPPMPPMMYGGGMLGFHEGGPVGHTHGFRVSDPKATSEYVTAPLEVIQQERRKIDEVVGGRDAEYEAAFQEWNQNQQSQGNFTATRKDFERSFEGRRAAGEPGRASEFITPSAVPHLAEAEDDVYDQEVEDLLATAESDAEYEHFRKQLETPVSRFAGLGSRRRRPDEVTRLREEDVTGIFRDQLESEEGLSGMGTAEERLAEAAVEEDLGISESAKENIARTRMEQELGLGSVSGLYGQAQQRIEDQLALETDPETYAQSQQLRSDAANKALTRAKGLKSLSDARIAEQESMLAEELGVSEARIKELRGEMETPESLDKRRRASLFSALGATLMGDPTQLGAGLERTTDKLLTLDEKIAVERERDLDKIAREREKGVERKRLGRGEIYDTTRTGLANWNTAQNAFDSEAYNMQKAVEDRDVGAHRQATTSMMNLLMDQAKTVAQYMTNAERYASELEKMKIQGRNYWVDPANWAAIDMEIDDLRADATRLKKTDPEAAKAMEEQADNMEVMKTSNVIASGQGMVAERTDRTVPTTGRVQLGPT